MAETTVITFGTLRLPDKRFLVLCCCVLLVGWIGAVISSPRPPMALPVTATLPQGETIIEAQQGKPAPDFTVQDPAGNLHSLSSYQGRPVVLYFWASWCPYCIDEMPGLNRLAETYREQGLVVLAVNILEQPAKVRHFLQGMNVSYPVLLDLDGHVTRSFLIRATPTYVFIDAEGVYRDQYIGTPRSGVLEAKIHALLHTTP